MLVHFFCYQSLLEKYAMNGMTEIEEIVCKLFFNQSLLSSMPTSKQNGDIAF